MLRTGVGARPDTGLGCAAEQIQKGDEVLVNEGEGSGDTPTNICPEATTSAHRSRTDPFASTRPTLRHFARILLGGLEGEATAARL